MIRSAILKDYDALVALFIEENTHNHSAAPNRVAKTSDVLTTDELNKFINDEQWLISIFEAEGRPVGLILASQQVQEASRWNPKRHTIYIEEFIVTELNRGNGIAIALYNSLVSWAEQTGASTVDLHVWANNELAIKFYERQGFMKQQYLMSKDICR